MPFRGLLCFQTTALVARKISYQYVRYLCDK